MRFRDWLFDRSASCAALRGELSLFERHVVCLSEELHAARLALKWSGEARGKLLHEKQHLQEDRDGLCRELWMARRSYDDLRLEAAKDYHHIASVAEMLRSRLEHAEAALKASETARKDLIEGGASS